MLLPTVDFATAYFEFPTLDKSTESLPMSLSKTEEAVES